jgi:hypothetical protein
MPDAQDWTPPAGLVEHVGDAIYNHPMSDSDALGVLIHASDYVSDDDDLPEQIECTRAICREIGVSALRASPLAAAVRLLERLANATDPRRTASVHTIYGDSVAIGDEARAFLAGLNGKGELK